jgi:hypothetical protein
MEPADGIAQFFSELAGWGTSRWTSLHSEVFHLPTSALHMATVNAARRQRENVREDFEAVTRAASGMTALT